MVNSPEARDVLCLVLPTMGCCKGLRENIAGLFFFVRRNRKVLYCQHCLLCRI